jgi:hypothetical protein
MAVGLTIYTDFDGFEDWPQPRFEPILARVEAHFQAKCTEVTLMSHGKQIVHCPQEMIGSIY